MERKYNMCDVALPAMSGRALATLVSAEVVMTGGDTVTVTQQHPARGRTAQCPPRTCPAQPWPGTLGQRRSGCSQHFIMVPAPP